MRASWDEVWAGVALWQTEVARQGLRIRAAARSNARCSAARVSSTRSVHPVLGALRRQSALIVEVEALHALARVTRVEPDAIWVNTADHRQVLRNTAPPPNQAQYREPDLCVLRSARVGTMHALSPMCDHIADMMRPPRSIRRS